MREIKFRAWHKDGEMLYNCPLNGLGQHAQFGADVTLMQYAGLHDKHEIEIYEGDIVRCESNLIRLQTGEPTGEKSIEDYEVIFHELMFTTKKLRNGYINPLAQSPSIWEKYYEIIGNIHENPGSNDRD